MTSRQQPRCTTRGCPVVYRGSGPDRPCPEHKDGPGDALDTRLATYGVTMSAPPDITTADTDSDSRGDSKPDAR